MNFSLEDYLLLKSSLTSSPLFQKSPKTLPAKRVLTKIEANLSSRLKNSIEGTREPTKIELKQTSDFSKSTLWFNLIEQSILNHKSIKITYESLESKKTTRQVDPYSLVFRRHAWYLIGFCHLREEIRIFRLNRIKK